MNSRPLPYQGSALPLSYKSDNLRWSGRRGSNSRHAAWKAAALPTELLPHVGMYTTSFEVKYGGERRIRTFETFVAELQSAPFDRSGISPLSHLFQCHSFNSTSRLSGAGTRIRTVDLLITSQLLYQLSYAGSFLAFRCFVSERCAV